MQESREGRKSKPVDHGSIQLLLRDSSKKWRLAKWISDIKLAGVPDLIGIKLHVILF